MMDVIKWLGIAFLWLVGLFLYDWVYHPRRGRKELREALKWLTDKIKRMLLWVK